MEIDNPGAGERASDSPRLGAPFKGRFWHVVFAPLDVIDRNTPKKVTKSASKKIKAAAMCDALRPLADDQNLTEWTWPLAGGAFVTVGCVPVADDDSPQSLANLAVTKFLTDGAAPLPPEDAGPPGGGGSPEEEVMADDADEDPELAAAPADGEIMADGAVGGLAEGVGVEVAEGVGGVSFSEAGLTVI